MVCITLWVQVHFKFLVKLKIQKNKIGYDSSLNIAVFIFPESHSKIVFLLIYPASKSAIFQPPLTEYVSSQSAS